MPCLPAESGQVHQVDVLNVGPLLKVRYQTPEGGGFQFGTGLVIHDRLLGMQADVVFWI
jgi:hypothetical protein